MKNLSSILLIIFISSTGIVYPYDSDFYLPYKVITKKSCCRYSRSYKAKSHQIYHVLPISPIKQKRRDVFSSAMSCSAMILKYYKNYPDPESIEKKIIKNSPGAETELTVDDLHDSIVSYMINRGLKARSFLPKNDTESKIISEDYFNFLESCITNRMPVMLHFESQYILAVGIDTARKRIFINDPYDGKRKTIDFAFLKNKENVWFQSSSGESTMGWDGRFVTVWKH